MARAIKVFLSYDFQFEQASWFKQKLKEIGGERIEIITAADAQAEHVPEKIKNAISKCDVVFFILTPRAGEYGKGGLPSPYVVSEIAYATALFQTRQNPEHHVFGFIENNVPPAALCIADRPTFDTPRFSRNDQAGCEQNLREYVNSFLSKFSPEVPYQAIRLHKTVYVRRDGCVRCESRFTHAIFDPEEFKAGTLQHSIWRVRKPLPHYNEMIHEKPSANGETPFLAGRLLSPNPNGKLALQLGDFEYSAEGHEITFNVSFKNCQIPRGSTVEYVISWGYPDAFQDNDTLTEKRLIYNSAGDRAGQIGTIREVTSEIRFQNEAGLSLDEMLEMPPKISRSRAAEKPANQKWLEFWNDNRKWRNERPMDRDAASSCILYESFVSIERDVDGYLRTRWIPVTGYHLTPKRGGQRKPSRPGEKSK